MRPKLRRLAAAACAIGVWVCGGLSRAAERLDYAVSVRVSRGTTPSYASLLDDVRTTIEDDLRARGCFRQVREAVEDAPEGDLVLDVVLDEVVEEARYEQTLAERARPTQPDETTQMASVVSMTVFAALRVVPGREPVREDRFHEQVTRRPVVPGEDARLAARLDAVRDIARKVRRKICGGSLKKLGEQIESAQHAASGE